MIHSIIKYIKDKRYRFIINASLGFYNNMSDEEYLKKRYYVKFGQELRVDNPVTFSEKLQWLKLNDRKSYYTKLVDKYEAKEYVASIIGEEYIISTIGLWDKLEDVDFESLPEQFVIKCTHDSGGLVIVKDKQCLDIKATKGKIRRSLKRNYYYSFREWPYKDVKPRIIAEEYISENGEADLSDYKFYCFNGVPQYCQVIRDRSTKQTVDFFDMDWVHQSFTGMQKPFKAHAEKNIVKPITFEKMKEFAKELSQDIPFVRVDFYEVSGKLYFGEMTFFPAAGFGEFQPSEWNEKLGNMLDLSCVK